MNDMVTVPDDKVTEQDLYAWYELHEQLGKIKSQEMLLRKKIFGGYFPEARDAEGTYTRPLDGGYVLKAVAKIDRSVDPGGLDALLAQIRDGEIAVSFNPESLVRYKPDLVLSEYRKLTEEERNLFDFCLVSKPGAPSLSIEKAPEAKKRAPRAKKGSE